MNGKTPLYLLIIQIIAGGLFAYFGFFKFMDQPESIAIFTQLEMEPFGRYLIGVIEVLVGLLLVSNSLSGLGGFIGVGVMMGAVISHVTVLGFSVNGDEGGLVGVLVILLGLSSLIAWKKRQDIPLIGKDLVN